MACGVLSAALKPYLGLPYWAMLLLAVVLCSAWFFGFTDFGKRNLD